MVREAIIERTDKECVHRFLTADNRELWLRTGVSVEPAAEGRAAAFRAISVDITDMMRSEEECKVLRKQLDEARQRLLELERSR
jgi:hypothetical protein